MFLSCFRQFTEQGSTRAEVISEIRAQLEVCKRARQFEVKFDIPKWENPRVLSFSLTSQTMLDQSVDFDVLPAFDALGEVPGMVPRRERRRRRRQGRWQRLGACSVVGIIGVYVYHHFPAKGLEKRTLSWLLVPSVPSISG